MRQTTPLAAWLLAAALTGCAAGDRVYDVSGTATFDGRPIPAGIIYFDPDPTKGGAGPQGFAVVKDGKYDTAVEGKGVRGGAYIVRITGYDGKVANEAPMGQALFAEYEFKKELPREKSELPIEVPVNPITP